jgi:Secretory lipase
LLISCTLRSTFARSKYMIEFRWPLSSRRNERTFFAVITAAALITPVLCRDQEVAQAPISSQAPISPQDRGVRPPRTLPLTRFYDTPQPLPVGKPGTLIRSEPFDTYELPFEISALRILYHSRTASGDDVAVSGVMLIPDGKPPAAGWPVIAWAHDFRGLARQCAPSLMKNLGAGPLLAMYANLGYVVVATDYAGLGSDSGGAALDMQSNALDVIYSVAAARLAVKDIGKKWIAIGQFQGSLAAVAVAESDIHDSDYLGSIATSGLADAKSTYQQFAQNSSARDLLALAFTLRTLYPKFQVSDMLKDAALPALQAMSHTCGGVGPVFTNDMLKQRWEDNSFVKEFFKKNTPGLKLAHSPLLVISGEKDTAIPAEFTIKTVARMCTQGDRITLLKYPELDASGVLGGSVANQISWIKARFAGYPAPSNCR